MTLLKRGSAVLAALLLIFQLVTYPVRAMSVVLPAAGLALTVTAFLNLAGIYPFDTESSFGDWSEGGLADLIQQYNNTNPAIQLNGETLHAYLYGGTAILTHNAYVALRAFVQWLVSEFSVTDNQVEVEFGEVRGLFLPVSDTFSDGVELASLETRSGTIFSVLAASKSATNIIPVGLVQSSSTYSDVQLVFGQLANGATGDVVVSNPLITKPFDLYLSAYANGVSYNVLSYGACKVLQFNIPVFSTVDECLAYIRNPDFSGGFSGITVDTSTVSVPPELPAEQEYIGLAISPGTVSGADTPAVTMTPQAVERIIQQGVTERQRPVVTTTEVEIAPGVDVDGTTGAVTENPVVITPDTAIEEIVPSVSELTAPQTFLDSLATTMQTKFPFCLPFDIMRLASAFRAEPVAPVIALTFHDPFTDEDYSIRVDLSPWDGVAQVVRSLETAVLFVGFWLNFDKFNVISMIFGQLG